MSVLIFNFFKDNLWLFIFGLNSVFFLLDRLP